MLSKKFIFYFLISFSATFILGFFVWAVFVDFPGNFIKPVFAEINSKFFIASVTPPDENLNQNNNNQESQTKDINLLNPSNIGNQNDIVASSEDVQDQLDNIQEKLDIIKQKVQVLVEEQNQNNQLVLDDKDKTQDDKIDQNKDDNQNLDDKTENTSQTLVCAGQININTASAEDLDKITQVGPATAQKIIQARPFYLFNDLLKVSGIGLVTLQKIIEQGCAYVEPGLAPPVLGGGGGGSAPVLKNILISEIQVAGQTADDEFVELYNPNNIPVDLSGFTLKKKVFSGTHPNGTESLLVRSEKFSGLIDRLGYFLVIPQKDKKGNEKYTGQIASDVLRYSGEDYSITPNNIILLYNNDTPQVLSDEISLPQIATGLSWCADFVTCSPTPKAPNAAYIVPPVPVDTTIPVITSIGSAEITITVGDAYIDAGATALDNVDGDITANIATINPVDANAAGDYIITYNVSDAAGNHAIEVTRLVHVLAAVNPPADTPSIIEYTFQVADQDPVSDNNVSINSSNGVKIQITTDKSCKFEIWINDKKYWYTDNLSENISRPSSCGS
ncbi:MAG: DUF5011 domain-containing protein [Candidatus Staskawiczbacteria bacterium]|nr:DUF5011 domain-containing protein [Candidatus Staskawiczbacteria bacterium]